MHPEIVRDAAGSRPICGMALEPMVPSDEPSGGCCQTNANSSLQGQ
ncbi:heavy metal-binding domain-containing protein [Oceanibium sediminis]